MQECKNLDAMMFFDKMPQAFPLFEAFEERLFKELDKLSVKVQKSQITYTNRHVFTCVSLPGRRIKNCPEVYILVTFGLNHRLYSPRIQIATEPYPNRWTHHVVVSQKEDIDNELMAWIKEAYDFSMLKR